MSPGIGIVAREPEHHRCRLHRGPHDGELLELTGDYGPPITQKFEGEPGEYWRDVVPADADGVWHFYWRR